MGASPLAFARKYMGQRVTAPGGIGGECVDLCNLWLAEGLALPHVYRNAVDWQRPIEGLAWQTNLPRNVPPSGAVVVWDPTPSLGVGRFGHVAVVLCAEVMSFLSIDQAWGSDTVGMVIHPYTGVAGWQCHS